MLGVKITSSYKNFDMNYYEMYMKMNEAHQREKSRTVMDSSAPASINEVLNDTLHYNSTASMPHND